MAHDLAIAERRRQSIHLLKEVLDGQTLMAVSARAGLSRSAVERRVKSLAAELTEAVGVEGLRHDGAAFVKRLRLRREAILSALGRFEPSDAARVRGVRVLAPDQVGLGALRVRSRAKRPNHDLALYHLAFATGLRPLEAARLRVADYLREDGSVRVESSVRSEAAINGKTRPLFFWRAELDESLGAYLQERLARGEGAGTSSDWRGLDPQSALFLDVCGQPYPITATGGAGRPRYLCRAMLEIYRRIFRHAGVAGLCTQSARLTLMSRMYEQGADEDQVGLVLGIADRSAVREQLARPRRELADVFREMP